MMYMFVSSGIDALFREHMVWIHGLVFTEQ